MLEANPELTETERQEYFTKRTEEMLSLVDKYNYDGVIVDYVGRSLVSLKDEPLRTYIARQRVSLILSALGNQGIQTNFLFLWQCAIHCSG